MRRFATDLASFPGEKHIRGTGGLGEVLISLSWVADLVLIAHFLWVLAVVLPIPLIVIGARRRWRWVRSYPLRGAHLAMIGVVVFEVLLGIVCPLTRWEDFLRKRAGQTAAYRRSFVEDWVGRALYHDFPPWIFTILYLLVGLLVLALFFWIPPERRSRRRSLASSRPR